MTRIAIDLHDTLAGYVAALEDWYGPAACLDSGILREMWPHVDWDAHFLPEHHNRFLASLEPLSGAVGGVWQLSRRFDCFYLSANHLNGQDATERWLHKHKFPPLELVLCDGKEQKEEIIRRLPADIVVIDDMPQFLQAARETGKLAVALAQPWNGGYTPRYKDWKELCEALLERREK